MTPTICTIQAGVTKLCVDASVNAGNTSLLASSGVSTQQFIVWQVQT